MKCWAKQKAHLHRPAHTQTQTNITLNTHNRACSIYCNGAKLTHEQCHLFLSSRFSTHTHTRRKSPTHTEKMPNGLQTSNFQPTLATLQSEITLPPPPQSAISTMQQLDPPCQTSENAITPLLGAVLCLHEKNNQRSTHPSIQREGRIPFPISPLIWDGNELVRKNAAGEVKVQPRGNEKREGRSKCMVFNH